MAWALYHVHFVAWHDCCNAGARVHSCTAGLRAPWQPPFPCPPLAPGTPWPLPPTDPPGHRPRPDDDPSSPRPRPCGPRRRPRHAPCPAKALGLRPSLARGAGKIMQGMACFFMVEACKGPWPVPCIDLPRRFGLRTRPRPVVLLPPQGIEYDLPPEGHSALRITYGVTYE